MSEPRPLRLRMSDADFTSLAEIVRAAHGTESHLRLEEVCDTCLHMRDDRQTAGARSAHCRLHYASCDTFGQRCGMWRAKA